MPAYKVTDPINGPTLPEHRRKKLDGIVQQMTANGELALSSNFQRELEKQ